MIIGVMTVELALLEAQTLKDKRRVIQGLKQRLRNKFNVSVAEVAYGDTPKRCRLGVATVSNESRHAQSMLDTIVDSMRQVAGLTLVDYHQELL